VQRLNANSTNSKKPMEMDGKRENGLTVVSGPEKAGVGGSTPSLATIIPKNLAAQS
jgi:hypothetical protein